MIPIMQRRTGSKSPQRSPVRSGRQERGVEPARPALPTMAIQRAIADPGSLSPQDMQRLQRAVGNRAVTQLAAARHPSASWPIQAKLTVGAASDRYEQEADRVAAQVMRTPAASPTAAETVEQRSQPAQRLVGQREELQTKRASMVDSFEAGSDFEGRLAATRSGGSPLPGSTRQFMEPRFGADFSGVRVHTGSESAQLNRAVSAQAFTHGSHIYLGEGKNNLESSAGKQLLAHELTHVVQQGAASTTGRRKFDPVQAPGSPGVTISRTPQTIHRSVKMYESFEDARKASKKEKITGTETELTVSDLDTAFGKVVTAMTSDGITLSGSVKKKMKAKLKEWIQKDASMAPATAWFKKKFTGGAKLNTGRAQDKRFGSYLALGQALMGHIESRQHKKTEASLAAKTKKSAYIKGKLREVQRAVFTAVEAITDVTLKQDVWKGITGASGARRGEYFHWYKNRKNIKRMMQ